MSDSQQLHAIVHGHVHGVNFRYSTLSEAHRLKLVGWVANVFDGTVEVVAEGPRAALEELLMFLHRGPSSAYVTAVDARWSAATGAFDRFIIADNR